MRNEHDNYCKSIADKLEAISDGTLYKCPECGEWIEWEDSQYSAEEGIYICPECGAIFKENELEAVGMAEYFENALDIDYITNSRNEYKACRIMVACGGPNVYVNTWERKVELHWWNETGSMWLSCDACNAIDEAMEDIFNCL
jgi:predicted RNA-binding Zn-ribbon protein involved in translation (DUF1610 family)